MHFKEHDGIRVLTIAVKALEVDQLIGIVSGLSIASAVGRRKEVDAPALERGIALIELLLDPAPVFFIKVRIHAGHTGGDHLFL